MLLFHTFLQQVAFPGHQALWEPWAPGSLPSGPTSLPSLTFFPIHHTTFPSDQARLLNEPAYSYLWSFAHTAPLSMCPSPLFPPTEHLLILQGLAQPPYSATVISVGFPEPHYLQFEEVLRVVHSNSHQMFEPQR